MPLLVAESVILTTAAVASSSSDLSRHRKHTRKFLRPQAGNRGSHRHHRLKLKIILIPSPMSTTRKRCYPKVSGRGSTPSSAQRPRSPVHAPRLRAARVPVPARNSHGRPRPDPLEGPRGLDRLRRPRGARGSLRAPPASKAERGLPHRRLATHRPQRAGERPRSRAGSSYRVVRLVPANPDGNGWLLQEITTRLPGRIDEAADVIRLRRRSGERDAACGGRPRRAREAHRAARRELARLVRRLHGGEQAGGKLPE